MKFQHKIIATAILVCLIVACFTFASCERIHEHAFGKWGFDNNYHWQVCSCEEQIGQKQKHTVSDWQVDVAATESSVGSRHGVCTECNQTVTEVIPKLSHTHSHGSDYVSDELGHWKECACGDKENFGEHEVSNWIVDVEPTETTQGQQHGTCSVCGKTVNKSVPTLGHSHKYVSGSDSNYHYLECACGDKTEVVAHTYSQAWKTNDTKHWRTCTCGAIAYEGAHDGEWIIDTPATITSAGSKHEECSVCHKSLRTQTIPQLTNQPRTVDLYAINDFHGKVDLISSVGGYLKERKNNNANTVLINSGDMFQGSMESNSNYGKLLTDCMDAVGFDALTFGNHEFDWGLDKLQALAENSNVPFLGANIYHWNASNKTWGTYADELAQPYVIKTLDNGLKVGIIGVIGEKQITSISSNLVQTIGFKQPLPIIKQLATELRNEHDCDIVVVSAHASPRGLLGESEGTNDPEQPSSAHDLQNYVDVVFCAHSHRQQNFTVDGLTFIQGGSYGSHVSRVTLAVSSAGVVNCTAHENISYSSSWPNILAVDSLVKNSNDKIKDERNEVLIDNLEKTLNKNPAMARLVCRAIAEYAANQGCNISLAMVNTARSSLYRGTVTYSELYESIPFDNVVYIAKVKGEDIINEVGYGNYYWRSSGEAIESGKWYMIAVIDYLLFHQSSNRDYNYFPSAFTSGFTPVALTNDNYDVYNYRLITRDYLLYNTINPNDYLYENRNTDTSLLQQTVQLDHETTGEWGASAIKPNSLQQNFDCVKICYKQWRRRFS